MNFRNLLRNKGLVFAVSGLVGLFLLFLLIINIIQNNSINYIRHVDSVNRISNNLTAGLYDNKVDLLLKSTQQLKASDDFKGSSLSQFNTLITSVNQQKNAFSQVDYSKVKQNISGLARSLELERDKKTNLARYMQIAAAILVIVFVVLIIFPLISRLARQEDTVVEVKKETEGIMSTVTEGLFLLTTDNEFGIEQSTSLKEMFRSERDLEGDFFDFIANYVPQSTIQVTKDYLDLLYGDRVKEKLVKDLNPLNEVEINIARRDGSFESRFLDFKFSRVMEDNKLSHLLGSVTDVTREVTLRNQLQESREEQEAQLDLLMSILHIDNKQLKSFFQTADTTLDSINKELEAKGHSDGEIRRKLNGIFENAHRLKGDAAALGLHKFEFSVHALEEAVSDVQKNTRTISGKDLLPAVTQLKVLFSEVQNIRGLVTKFADNFSDTSSANTQEDSENSTQTLVPAGDHYSSLEQPLHNIVSTLCDRTDKRASLLTYGLGEESDIPADLAEVMVSSSVQFIRNSIVHGGLLPLERLEQQKTDFLNIVTSVTKSDQGYTLIVRDDGEGLDEDAILARAIEMGLIDEDAAQALKPGAAVRYIFQPGFSTKDDADIDAGRGVGLNAVYSMIKKAGGTISLRHKKGGFCQFQAFFPHVNA